MMKAYNLFPSSFYDRNHSPKSLSILKCLTSLGRKLIEWVIQFHVRKTISGGNCYDLESTATYKRYRYKAPANCHQVGT